MNSHRLSRARPTTLRRQTPLVVADVLLCGAAGIGAFWFWSFTRGQSWGAIVSERWYWIPGLAAVWIFLAWSADLYDFRLLTQADSLAPRILVVAGVMMGGYLILFFAIAPRSMLARLPIVYFLLLALILTGGWRWLFAGLAARGVFRQKTLIIGAGWAGQTVAELLLQRGRSDFDIIGFVDDDPAKIGLPVAGLPVLGMTTEAPAIARRQQVEVVIFAITHVMSEQMFQTLLDCEAMGLQLLRMPDLYKQMTGRVPVEHIRPDWLLFTRAGHGLTSWSYRIFVHVVDILFVSLAGLFLLLIGPLIALLIKLGSPGPIFYRQVRLGLMGTPFELFKFRSMVVDAEAESGAQWASLDDPRVTGVGRFLRYTRLDELPQVINILRGDIHLIGPRPERPEFVSQLEEIIPYYRSRLIAKPGLTGWAQVEYEYGYSVEGAQVKLEYDLYYIQNRSVLLDLRILLKTVSVVFLLKGT